MGKFDGVSDEELIAVCGLERQHRRLSDGEI